MDHPAGWQTCQCGYMCCGVADLGMAYQYVVTGEAYQVNQYGMPKDGITAANESKNNTMSKEDSIPGYVNFKTVCKALFS